MTEPNIVNVSAIKSFFLSWDILLGKNVLLANADNSNQIFKVTDIKLSNFNVATPAMITVVLGRNNIEYAIIKNVIIQPNATISVVTSETEIILEEGDSVIVYSEEENQSLSASISYLVISETTADHNRAIFSLSAQPSIGTNELLTVNFISRNITDGNISYEISGVTTEDIDNFPLSGTFNVVNGAAQIQFEVKESGADKIIVFSVPSLSASVSIEVSGSLYAFTAATFTSGSQEGSVGPTLSQAKNGLSGPEVNTWKENTEFFNTSNGIQLWTVPADGNYRIEAWGAGADVRQGGNGARMRGDFQLQAGEIIRILVGQHPSPFNTSHGGGAGGTFVVKAPYNTNESILVIAGGGGGGHSNGVQPNSHGRTTTDGGSATNGGVGGVNGNAGTSGEGVAGSGFFTGATGGQGTAGNSFIGGGVGSVNGSNQAGFGGGGSQGNTHGGGGGGYSGGGGANATPWHGGGGGSFNSGTNQSNSAGVRTGNGQVEITLL